MGPWIVREVVRTLGSLDLARAVGDVCARQDPRRRWGVILIGKNAVDIMRGVSLPAFSGIVVAPPDALPPHSSRRWTLLPGDHPVPGRNSFAAGRAILEFARDPSHEAFFVGLSGGGSALAEVPLAPWFTQADLRRANRDLLASPLSIRQINTVRKRLSALKGGRLAQIMGKRPGVTVLLSDVERGQESSIASGPTLPDDAMNFDAFYLARQFPKAPWSAKLEGSMRAFPETPKPGDPLFRNKKSVLLYDNARLLEEVRRRLNTRIRARIMRANAGGTALEVLPDLMNEALRLKSGQAVIFGGEFTLALPEKRGKGGRVAHLGLMLLDGLSASGSAKEFGAFGLATDGMDGTSPDPGFSFEAPAIPQDAVRKALERFDGGAFFHGRGLGIPRPKRTFNLRDIFIVWRNG